MKPIEEQREYWRKQLSALPPLPTLPLDKERPPVSSFLRERLTVDLDPRLWQGIEALAASNGATSQVVLLAALNALLFRYTGQTDLVVGTLLSSHHPESQGTLVPLRTRLSTSATAQELVRQLVPSITEACEHLGLPLVILSELAGIESGARRAPLFNIALTFTRSGDRNGYSSIPTSHEWSCAEFLADCSLVFHASQTQHGLSLVCEYDAELLESATVARLGRHFVTLLAAMTADSNVGLDRLTFITGAELRQLLVDWNATVTEVPKEACIQHLFEAQADRTPEAVAAVCRDRQITYAELNIRANRLAHYLRNLGVGPDVLVGICVERSVEMLVGLLGILKAGGAYLPLDPSYPAERIAFMLQDAQVKLLLTQGRLVSLLPAGDARLLCLDSDWPAIAPESGENLLDNCTSANLAYVIYTSGSTGKPKGVMIEHRNVINFFAGMDARIQYHGKPTWLAVTSLSFDISVLELFWTLAHGFKVVLFAGDVASRASARAQAQSERPMEFSLFYFSSEQTDGPDGAYRLLIEGAKFADEHGFAAVWTPERHFHDFGGLYPNPSVTSAALAMVTKGVQLRSGSVVAPLHSPIRIAEEWSVVDNLSHGRVAISFASGWMPEDFAINPAAYANRKEIMLQHLDVVRRLWRGESVPLPGPLGKPVAVKVFPRPVQRDLPLWLTAAGNPETFQIAGTLGINLLTHLLGQSIEEVAKKVALYREAWKQAGHPGQGCVTLMLHTFLGDSLASVKQTVRAPLLEYLRKSADLIKGYAWAFSAFKHQAKSKEDIDFSALSKLEMDAILAHAFERYFETSGLFGTTQSCIQKIEMLKANDIDEVACLIDFGVSVDLVLESLNNLNALRQAVLRKATATGVRIDQEDLSIPELIERHNVTHLQCTPSMASMLLLDHRTKDAFGKLQTLLIGGEGFPVTLAAQLRSFISSNIINMYGPTETTVWSSTYPLPPNPSRVPVGRPIANTEIYLLDANLQPVPVGIPGELMIGGQGVARGYLNRPELTAERFIHNHFNGNGSGRLYRTGDLARYLPDGNIELLGRMDHQVKIRGHRIELGEIEALLNEHPMVREAVVIARDAANGDKRLVAYVIPRAGVRPTFSQIRQFAKDKLPEYMAPAQVVFMTEFPQTPNKKIDRKALPIADNDGAEVESAFDPPATAVEQVVAAIWAELLGVQRVSRTDNFFELGGNSLSATQLVSRLREVFRVNLPLASAFDAPTLMGTAALLAAHEPRPGTVDRTAKLFKQIEGMSEEAVQGSLNQKPEVVTHGGA